MTEVYLTHYYHGNRFLSYKTGLGTIIRAKGHSLHTKIIFIDDNFAWFDKQSLADFFDVNVIDISQIGNSIDMIQEIFVSSENEVVLLANFDLIIEHNIMKLSEICYLIENKSKMTEVLLTGEHFYSEIVTKVDYVSEIKLTKN
jgi:ATP:corrinoid adenosyltransferase